MSSLVVALIVCTLILALLFTAAWAIASYSGAPPPFKAAAYVIAALIGILVVLWAFGLLGGPPFAHAR